MKNILKITTVVAFMFATVAGMAREPKLNLLTAGKAKSVVLTMEASSVGVQIKLMDSDLNVIYSEKVSEGIFSKKLNFKDLADGVYYLSADDNLKNYSYTIVLDKNNVKIVDADEDIKPFFRKTNNMILMNYLNLDKSKMSIKIYDTEGRTVFAQEVTDELIVEKAFNFTDAFPGVYVVIVKSDGKTYTEEFVVN
ncbi:T9SS type A sorting domain-containing protein [Maribacter sp. LLG6340-A2]|uniref:T9SS type A sorting domain-containing protein n=1 Tax=Maribacter sp. LLG6340-A2 TaxID=3160834 RepID=UPI0038701030